MEKTAGIFIGCDTMYFGCRTICVVILTCSDPIKMKWMGVFLLCALALVCAEKWPSGKIVVTSPITLYLSPGFNHSITPIGPVKDANGVEISNPEIGDIVLHNLRTLHMVLDVFGYLLIFFALALLAFIFNK